MDSSKSSAVVVVVEVPDILFFFLRVAEKKCLPQDKKKTCLLEGTHTC